MIEKILVPLDGSELSARMLAPVARIAERCRAEVRAIRVLDDAATRLAARDGENAYSVAASELGRALAPLDARGIRTTFDTYVGDAAARIVDDASVYRPSLVAMATHGRSGVERWRRGSVAERVLRASPAPVLVASPFALGGGRFRRILVPLDLSELSAAVLPLVGDLARIDEADVTLLTVRDAPGSPSPGEATSILEGFAQRLEGVRSQTLVVEGPPADVILETATKLGADLVAMTTHGRSGLSRWVYGSTAEHVLPACPAPLLLVRTAAVGAGG